MIVDASALLAVVMNEPDGTAMARAVARTARPRIPAPTWFEASMVIERRGDAVAVDRFDAVVRTLGLEIAPFTAAHAAAARQAWRRYGRGSRHPAKLNFGDCLIYGFAKIEREPLLFKGDDFPHTDIEPARPED